MLRLLIALCIALCAWPSPSIGGEPRKVDFTVQYCKEAPYGTHDCGPALNLRPKRDHRMPAQNWSDTLSERTRQSFKETHAPGEFYCVTPDTCAGAHGAALSITMRRRF